MKKTQAEAKKMSFGSLVRKAVIDAGLDPDEVMIDAMACILHRGGGGAWCGYVGVPKGHPWHGKHYDLVDADVHGGLTYSAECSGHVCHNPGPEEPDDLWWVGFDCGHCFDVVPAMSRWMSPLPDMRYRTVGYARAEIEKLAEQAHLAGWREERRDRF